MIYYILVKHANYFKTQRNNIFNIIFINVFQKLTFGGCLTRFEVIPEGSTGKTGTGELATVDVFLFAGGNNSPGKMLGIAYFSKAL